MIKNHNHNHNHDHDFSGKFSTGRVTTSRGRSQETLSSRWRRRSIQSSKGMVRDSSWLSNLHGLRLLDVLVSGRDLAMKLDIDVYESLCGMKRAVKTLDNREITISTRPGEVILISLQWKTNFFFVGVIFNFFRAPGDKAGRYQDGAKWGYANAQGPVQQGQADRPLQHHLPREARPIRCQETFLIVAKTKATSCSRRGWGRPPRSVRW